VSELRSKSRVLSLGLDLGALGSSGGRQGPRKDGPPRILWNHRWEYDKNPEEFFKALFVMSERGREFEVIVLGANYSQKPGIFLEAREKLSERILHFGEVRDRSEYAAWLRLADIIPVTSHQEFFGASVIEAVYCGAHPLLPRRLSYPEIFDDRRRPELFYESPGELVEKLDQLLLSEWTDYSAVASCYDWENLIGDYDRSFDQKDVALIK